MLGDTLRRSKVRHLEFWSHISNLAVFELPRSVIDHEDVVAFFIDTIGLVRVVESGSIPLGEDETDDMLACMLLRLAIALAKKTYMYVLSNDMCPFSRVVNIDTRISYDVFNHRIPKRGLCIFNDFGETRRDTALSGAESRVVVYDVLGH